MEVPFDGGIPLSLHSPSSFGRGVPPWLRGGRRSPLSPRQGLLQSPCRRFLGPFRPVERHRQAAVVPDGCRQAGQSLDVNIVKDTELPRKPLPGRLHVRGAGHGQPEAAFGVASVAKPGEGARGAVGLGVEAADGAVAGDIGQYRWGAERKQAVIVWESAEATHRGPARGAPLRPMSAG